MVSLGVMIKRIAGLQDTRDVTAWENGFIGKMIARTNNGAYTSTLFPKEVEKIEEIHDKHFA